MATIWIEEHSDHMDYFFDEIIYGNFIDYCTRVALDYNSDRLISRLVYNLSIALAHYWEHAEESSNADYLNLAKSLTYFPLVKEIANAFKHFNAQSGKRIKSITSQSKRSIPRADEPSMSTLEPSISIRIRQPNEPLFMMTIIFEMQDGSKTIFNTILKGAMEEILIHCSSKGYGKVSLMEEIRIRLASL